VTAYTDSLSDSSIILAEAELQLVSQINNEVAHQSEKGVSPSPGRLTAVYFC